MEKEYNDIGNKDRFKLKYNLIGEKVQTQSPLTPDQQRILDLFNGYFVGTEDTGEEKNYFEYAEKYENEDNLNLSGLIQSLPEITSLNDVPAVMDQINAKYKFVLLNPDSKTLCESSNLSFGFLYALKMISAILSDPNADQLDPSLLTLIQQLAYYLFVTDTTIPPKVLEITESSLPEPIFVDPDSSIPVLCTVKDVESAGVTIQWDYSQEYVSNYILTPGNYMLRSGGYGYGDVINVDTGETVESLE